MKKLITFTAGLLLTASALASTATVHQSTTFEVGSYQTKAEAYDAGFALSDSLKGMDDFQLQNKLSLWAYNSVRDIVIDQSAVVIQETATSRDNIEYQAVVNLDYNFKAREDND